MSRRTTLVLAAFVLGLVSACGKSAYVEQDPTDVSYSRSGVPPVTLSAFNETRTTLVDNKIIQWNQGDVISLLSQSGGSVKCLSLEDVHKMKVGEKKSIIVVNPSKSGHFLGFNGKDVVKYTGDLSRLNGGASVNEEEAEKNLKTLLSNAEDLVNKEEYVFMLERVQEGWLLYHKATGIGLTKTIGELSGSYNKCVLGTDLAPLGMEDASSNAGTTNVVRGRPEQIYVRNAEYYLRSNIPLTWSTNPNGWTTWLFFEIPGNKYQFTADEAGVSVTFTNKTGFEAGSETWFAVYPESVFPTIKDGEMSLFLPSVQGYETDSFKDRSYVTAGILKDDQILFRSILGVLQLSLKGSQHVLSISVSDNAGASLWGDASVDLAQFYSDDCSAKVSGGGPALKLDCGKGVTLKSDQATDFYLVVPAGVFSKGFKVEITTSEGVFVRTTSKDNTIVRGDIKEMPAFTLNPDQAEVREVNIENDVVAAYMAMGTYPSSFGEDNSYFSYGEVYSLASACKWSNDQPVGVTVSLDGEPPFVLTVTQDGEEWYTKSDFTGTEYTITNLTPGCTYTYSMTDGRGERVEGKFKAVGQVRMVSIQDAWNYRDLGGWTGLDGATIKYGKLFRGGSLNGTFEGKEGPDYQNAEYDKFTFHGQEDIDHLGIRAELDLRGDPTLIPGQWGKEQYAHSVSLLQTKLKDATFIRIMSDFGLYYPFQRSSIIQDVAWMIQQLQEGRPVAFHCRSGADRTGAVSLLIEGLLGVSEGDAARDYELTSLSPETGTRFANSASYEFFKQSSGLFSIKKGDLTFQEQCYYYLNRSFDDVHINAKDLDWFICEMLGLTSYTHPIWAEDYPDNDLSKVFTVSTGSGSYTRP